MTVRRVRNSTTIAKALLLGHMTLTLDVHAETVSAGETSALSEQTSKRRTGTLPPLVEFGSNPPPPSDASETDRTTVLPSRAEPGAIDATISFEGTCVQSDTEEIRRLLLRELHAAAPGAFRFRAPTVLIVCGDSLVTTTVTDPVSAQRVTRTFPAPANHHPARNQEIALAISQAFLSSWVEILLLAPEQKPTPSVGPERTNIPAPPASERTTVEPPKMALFRIFLGGGLGLEALPLHEPTASPLLSVRSRLQHRSGYWALVEPRLGWLSLSRPAADVGILSGGGLLALGVDHALGEHVATTMGFGLGAVGYHAEPRPRDSNFEGRTAGGITLSPEVRAGMTLVSSSVIVRLEAMLRYSVGPALFELDKTSSIDLSGPALGVHWIAEFEP